MKINNILKNPTIEVDPFIFNDKDILNNLLTITKDRTNHYSIAMNEASNQNLYETYFEIFKETQNMHRAIYNLMFKKGWYSIEIENQKKLLETYDFYKEYIKEK